MTQRQDYDARVHDASGAGALAVTPSDTATIRHTRGIYVGVTGDLAVRMLEGNNVTFVAVPAGALLPIRVDQVLNTGTTAGSIVAIF